HLNYSGDNQLIIHCLGALSKLLPGIGLPSLLYVLVAEVFRSSTLLFKKRPEWSLKKRNRHYSSHLYSQKPHFWS
ncbi:MAG: hypothetical protein VX210_12265, partial [Myxococcota bacterium]|nr:hypothetical protein [Myxococcota bacterium]